MLLIPWRYQMLILKPKLPTGLAKNDSCDRPMLSSKDITLPKYSAAWPCWLQPNLLKKNHASPACRCNQSQTNVPNS
jgi:hypothetical protein